jgi:hypothetical protein
MVIRVAATFPGLVLTCRDIGILQIEQKSPKRSPKTTEMGAIRYCARIASAQPVAQTKITSI